MSNEVISRFSPLDQKLLKKAEEKFKKIARSVCPDLRGENCTLTGKACSLYDCPKIAAGGEKEKKGRPR